MKPYFLLPAAFALTLNACSNEPTGSSSSEADSTGTAQQGPVYKVYGDTITADGAMSVADLGKALEGKDAMDAKVACEITTSCAKKGCWMDVKMADGSSMTVHFKDYAFFVPTSGLEGKQAIIQGRATKEVQDVAWLRHKAADEGKSPEECEKITAPETSWSFMADGVLIRD